MKKSTLLFSFLLMQLIPLSLKAQWQQTNGPDGGYINSFTISGSNVFCAANGEGVFKSTSSGSSWVASSNGLIHPVYISSLTNEGSNIYAAGVGLFESTDNGSNWISIMGDLPSNVINKITISGNTIFVGVYPQGIYKSTNNGINWLSTGNGLPNNPYIISLYSTSNSIFVCVYSNSVYGTYRSTNGGQNWNLLSNGFPSNQPASCFTSNSSYIFAGSIAMVYRSSDNGDTWQQTTLGAATISGLTTNNNIIFASTAGSGVYVSFNNGTNWNQVNNGLPIHNQIATIIYSNGNVIAGTEWTGIYVTTNNGTSWTVANSNVTSTRVYAVNSIGSALYAGTDGNQLFATTDNGDNWVWLHNGLPSYCVIGAFYYLNNRLFAGLNGPSAVYYSTDNGANWILSNSNISVRAFSSINNNLFVCGSTVLRSNDNGSNWTQITNGLPAFYPFYVTSLAMNGNSIYCGIDRYGVYISTNLGDSWTAASSGLTNKNIFAMTTNDSNIFACTDTSGVFKSTNGGASWQPANNGLTDLMTNTIFSYGNYLFIGTKSGGIFRSIDTGNSWTSINTGLNNKFVTSIYVLHDYIYAGIYYQGIWRRLLSEVIAVTPIGNYVPDRYEVFQNFPNPFNPLTTIEVNIPKTSLTKIIVYDMLGREIEKLVNTELKAGSYKVQFDGSGLSSGVYLYRLQTSEFTETKRMVILK